MSGREPAWFPPRRLPALTEAQLTWVRPVWLFLLAAAVILDISGAIFVWRDVYRSDPSYYRLALASQIENDGSVTVSTGGERPDSVREVGPGSRIVAIDGKPVDRQLPVWDLAKTLRRDDGQRVNLTIAPPEGEPYSYRIAASNSYAENAEANYPMGRDLRMGLRLVISALTCLTLIGCGVLLFLRRPRDPVALLFSASFLIFAGVIDPPLIMWMAIGMGNLFDVYSSLAWLLLVIGLAVFPDGRFEPRWVRWLLPVLPIAAIVLTIDAVPLIFSAIIAFVLPLLLIVSQVIKYRRLEPGIERQQIKWAAFGFTSGFLLVAAALILTEILDETSHWFPLYGLLVLALFSFGFLAMALGLLISLTRFRLWEADKVISRSAISAAVTLAVGIFWTLSVDMLKAAAPLVLGQQNDTIATIAGAVLAAGLFAPTQTLVQRWAKKRLTDESDRIRNLSDRLAIWRATETPEEIGQRTLSSLARAVHCQSAAILMDGIHGRTLIASRDVENPAHLVDHNAEPESDPRFVLNLVLEDDDGPIGLLLVGPRSDDNRYNSQQLAGLNSLVEPLAEALRASRKRTTETATLKEQLGSVVERLARLEQDGRPKPA